ncbi:hypothetical protein NGM33_01405 [Nocardiopsis dassonvillei]|uniref:hypothetical protein n=1 Tax=Nocardiopsis dassonvillei TaxID=2014 RepID=UPI0020A4B4AD|nr:hypothetical protein [Nocardiopsis dassonvillei]MCP3011971.1 hypothetical protein [Nocardiopsis dassonvillei]
MGRNQRTQGSAFERLAADHSGWTISREPRFAIPSVWAATRGTEHLVAPTAADLLDRLEGQELARLQAEYGDRYSIRRSRTLWIATLRVDDGTEPTLMCDTWPELETRMRTPGSWGQVPRTRRPR